MFNSGGTYVGDANCPKCGKPYVYIGDPIGNLDHIICTCNRVQELHSNVVNYYQNWLRYGWICPICGVANSPDEKQCSCKTKEKE